MANVITNHLYIKGPQWLVDEFVNAGITACVPEPDGAEYPQWRVEHWGSKWIEYHDWDPPEIIEEADGTKVVRYSFDSAWDPPCRLFMAVVEKYHRAGLSFHLFWYDGDSYVQFEALALSEADKTRLAPFKEELFVGRFGEFYTELIPTPGYTIAKSGERIRSAVCTTFFTSEDMGVRYIDGPVLAIFNKQYPGDGAAEVLGPNGIVSYVPDIDRAKANRAHESEAACECLNSAADDPFWAKLAEDVGTNSSGTDAGELLSQDRREEER